MDYFVENTPFSSFLHDYDDDNVLVENDCDDVDDDLFPEDDLDEDFPEFIDNDWSWLM
jgi:hypothetical protein